MEEIPTKSQGSLPVFCLVRHDLPPWMDWLGINRGRVRRLKTEFRQEPAIVKRTPNAEGQIKHAGDLAEQSAARNEVAFLRGPINKMGATERTRFEPDLPWDDSEMGNDATAIFQYVAPRSKPIRPRLIIFPCESLGLESAMFRADPKDGAEEGANPA
jgi:hypothetical protein